MNVKVGEIYDIRKSILKYKFCCDYIRVARISPKTYTLEACYREENLIYAKKRNSRYRIYKNEFTEEIETKKIKVV